MTGNTDKSIGKNMVSKQTKKTVKHWVAVTLFAAIIIVFALWGIHPDQYGGATGGVAAVVNDTPISIAEYRNRVENMEQNFKSRLQDAPEAQRRMFTEQLRRRALEDLIVGEVMFQGAVRRGIGASDAEVRDYILQIPFLQEGGRFAKDRYRAWLDSMRVSTEDFERQVRKQVIVQKLQELFVGAAAPAQEEAARAEILSHQKVNLRFVQIREEDIRRSAAITNADVNAFLQANGKDVEAYYKGNPVEFTQSESARAHHILIRIDEKRPEAEALKQIEVIRKQANAQNFSKLATQHSEDPGSKAKGGDLGEFERGRMVPEFDQAVFALKEGEISAPIKTNFGYHLILLDKKNVGGLRPLADVQSDIARKLIARVRKTEVEDKLKAALKSGSKKEVEALVSQAGLKWDQTGEFDLSVPNVPKFEDSDTAVMRAVMKQGQAGGLVSELVSLRDGHVVLDVLSWKESSGAPAGKGGKDAMRQEVAADMGQMLAYRRSSELMEAWSRELTSTANIQRNARLLQSVSQ